MACYINPRRSLPLQRDVAAVSGLPRAAIYVKSKFFHLIPVTLHWRHSCTEIAREGGRRTNVCDLFTLCFVVQLCLARKR